MNFLSQIFSKATTVLFDRLDHGKDDVLPLQKFVELTETLGEVFHSKDLADKLRKLDPNKSDSLENFPL